MGFLKKYSKTSIVILIIIIALGIFVRFSHFSEESYWNDDMTTIPTALLWFYPHSYYPGLAGQGEPGLGNYFIGLGCMLSGQDFSKVTEIQPMFYPGRPGLIGREMVNAEKYCRLPMYAFGLLFFIAIIILAMLLLDEYASIFAIAFYSFSSFILLLSRWIHVDTIEYFFLAIGLIFLWKFYVKEINAKYEKLFLILAALSFGFALATKLPAGVFLVFLALIALKKYKNEALSLIKIILKKLNLKVNEKILHDENPEHSFMSFNRQILLDIYNFLITLNEIDLIIIILSVYTLIKLAFSKKDKNEEFLLYLFGLFLITLTFFTALNYTRVFYIFSPAIIFIMALTFSEKDYSIFNLFKINNRRAMFLVFIIIYTIFSFSTAIGASPHFTPKNQLLCVFNGPECSQDKLRYFTNVYGLAAKQTANGLNNILGENETFISSNEVIYYYTRQEDSYELYLFINSARKQIDRRPNLGEFIKYFRPGNRTVRYAVVNPNSVDADFPEFEELKKKSVPNYVIKAYGMDAAYIYDLNNLKLKK